MLPCDSAVPDLSLKRQQPSGRFEMGLGTEGRRLVKVVSGSETELWSDAKGYAKDEPILASLECLGRRIACYVNGAKVCEVVDDAFSTFLAETERRDNLFPDVDYRVYGS